jgi:hypothetical protein
MLEKAITYTNTNLNRMTLLGLNKDVLTQAMWAGLSQYRSASKLEPLNAGGSKASFSIVQTLREQLLGNGLGWVMLNKKGQCLTNNPEKQISIIVTSGDKYTGVEYTGINKLPCTKNGKGSTTKKQIKGNLEQTLCLFEEGLISDRENLPDDVIDSADDNELWVLLYHFDISKKEVRFELSLPIGYKEVGAQGKVKVSKWDDRLIFTPLSFDEDAIRSNTPDFDDEIEFNIIPKE